MFVETHFGSLKSEQLEKIINQKNIEENAMFKGSLPFYKDKEVFCHLLLFETKEAECQIDYFVRDLPNEFKNDKERGLASFLFEEYVINGMYLTQIVVNTSFEDSFLVFILDSNANE